MAQRQLMLKEYLELDSKSESCRQNPPAQSSSATVRCLLQKDLLGGADNADGGVGLVRFRSKGALTKLSSVIHAVRILNSGDGRSSPARLLRRSFSKNLRRHGYFWRRTGSDDADLEKKKNTKVSLKDIVRMRSFGNCSSSSGSAGGNLFIRLRSFGNCSSSSGSAGGNLFIDGKQESPSRSSEAVGIDGELLRPVSGSGSRELKEICNEMECGSEEEELLSPFSVLDFPYQDEEEDDDVAQSSAASSCSLQDITMEHQLLPKIRRFDVRAGSTDHVARGQDEAEDEEQARLTAASMLVGRLAGGQPRSGIAENLLHDFFAESLFIDEYRRRRRWTKRGGEVEEELLRAATGWLAGDGEILVGHDGKVAALREMERRGGWSGFEEEEAAVAADVAGGLVTYLMEEIVQEFVRAGWLINL